MILRIQQKSFGHFENLLNILRDNVILVVKSQLELAKFVLYVRKCVSLVYSWSRGSVMASWLVRLSPDRAAVVRALARDIVLCSWARHVTRKMPLSTQVYKWVLANVFLEYSQLRFATETGNKHRCDGPLGSFADFIFTFTRSLWLLELFCFLFIRKEREAIPENSVYQRN